MEELKIFGFKRKKTVGSWEEKIDYAMDDGLYDFYLSKKKYEYCQRSTNKSFSYRYLICFEDAATRDEKTGYYINLELAIESSCWHENIKKQIAEMCGIEVKDVNVLDGYWDGGVAIPLKSIYVPIDDKDVPLLKIANVLDAIDARRGYYFRRAWNKAGTTGWDVIRHTLEDTPLF